jgi:hypothetical protein
MTGPFRSPAISCCLALLMLGLSGCDGSPLPPAGLSTPVPREDAGFLVGAAKRDSTPALPICTGGYGIFCNRRPVSVRVNVLGEEDWLFTRAAVFESGGEKLVIVTTSAIGLFAAYRPVDGLFNAPPGLQATRERIAQRLGIAPKQVLIQPDHSHYAADTVGICGGATDPDVFFRSLTQISDAMVEAAVEADAARRPASLWVGTVQADRIVCPETVPKCELSSLYNFEPNLWVDNEFRVLEARDGDGSRILTLANYSTHATVLDGIAEDITLSADWTGWFAVSEDETPERDGCGGADQRPCAVGMATLGTLGRTDFNDALPGITEDATALERNLARERAARLRLDYFMALLREQQSADCRPDAPAPCVNPLTEMRATGIEVAERLISEVVIQPVFYANYLPFVGLPPQLGSLLGIDSEFVSSTASIERSNRPPWLSANVIATPVSAARLGSIFFGVAPGEQFPNSQQQLRDEGGVVGPSHHFFLGVTNDFIGYMAPTTTYDQVTAQGLTFLAGCPENNLNDVGTTLLRPPLAAIGYEAGRLFDPTCPDHWILMASATVGDHVTCSVAALAEDVGFTTGALDESCAVLTATDRAVE